MVADPEKQYPRIVCRNLDHFEPVILPEESREAAALLYQNLRPSGNIALLDSDTPAPRTAADDERSGRDVEQRQERPDDGGNSGEQIGVTMAIHRVGNNFGGYFQVMVPTTRAVGGAEKSSHVLTGRCRRVC